VPSGPVCRCFVRSLEIHIWGLVNPILVNQIFLCSLRCVVFIKNMKLAMFCSKIISYDLCLLIMFKKEKYISHAV